MSSETFPKTERLCSKLEQDRLFKGRSHTKIVYPIKAVYCESETTKVLFSVPKRNFKHAVDRNRVKRQFREAYRKNKAVLNAPKLIAFIYLDNKHCPSSVVERRMVKLLSLL